MTSLIFLIFKWFIFYFTNFVTFFIPSDSGLIFVLHPSNFGWFSEKNIDDFKLISIIWLILSDFTMIFVISWFQVDFCDFFRFRPKNEIFLVITPSKCRSFDFRVIYKRCRKMFFSDMYFLVKLYQRSKVLTELLKC